MTYYISIQRLDWDDYPTGLGDKVGPFDTRESAFEWMDDHPEMFSNKTGYFWSYKFKHYGDRNHSIRVRAFKDDLASPEYFEELYS